MEIVIKKSYHKQLQRVPKHIRKQAFEIEDEIRKAKSLYEINDCKKLEGYKNYFRIKISNYRMGLKLEKPTVVIICILERSQIYKQFP